MSKEIKTMPGVVYRATMTKVGRVHGVTDGGGRMKLNEASGAGQVRFQAISGLTEVEDDAAVVLPVRDLPPGVVLEDGVQAEQVAEMVRGGVEEANAYAEQAAGELLYEVVEQRPAEGAEDNYTGYGFGCVMEQTGAVLALELECREGGTAAPEGVGVWVKVWRVVGGTPVLAGVSEQAQVHAVGAVLRYTFAEPLAVAAGDEVRVSFHAEDGLAVTSYQMGLSCCLRVVAKDASAAGGVLGAVGGYGADGGTQRQWVPVHRWTVRVGRFASKEHVHSEYALKGDLPEEDKFVRVEDVFDVITYKRDLELRGDDVNVHWLEFNTSVSAGAFVRVAMKCRETDSDVVTKQPVFLCVWGSYAEGKRFLIAHSEDSAVFSPGGVLVWHFAPGTYVPKCEKLFFTWSTDAFPSGSWENYIENVMGCVIYNSSRPGFYYGLADGSNETGGGDVAIEIVMRHANVEDPNSILRRIKANSTGLYERNGEYGLQLYATPDGHPFHWLGEDMPNQSSGHGIFIREAVSKEGADKGSIQLNSAGGIVLNFHGYTNADYSMYGGFRICDAIENNSIFDAYAEGDNYIVSLNSFGRGDGSNDEICLYTLGTVRIGDEMGVNLLNITARRMLLNGTNVGAHLGDTKKHITEDERTKWNAAAAADKTCAYGIFWADSGDMEARPIKLADVPGFDLASLMNVCTRMNGAFAFPLGEYAVLVCRGSDEWDSPDFDMASGYQLGKLNRVKYFN